MNKQIYVIARTHQDFLRFLYENKLPKHHFQYISNAEAVRGIDNFKVVYLSNWSDRHDAMDISDAIDTRRGVEMMKERDFVNALANYNVTPGNQPPKENDISAYPVSQKTFNYFKQAVEFKSIRTVNGLKLYRIEQVDKHSGVEVVFDIYISPNLDTNFTEIKSIPINLPK